jgi:Tfp pilus assembly protein PilV
MYSVERRSTRGRSGGFSLVEALVATFLLSVALLGLSSNAISLTRNNKTADSTSSATALAIEKLEQLRSMPLGAAEHASGDYLDPLNPLNADGTPLGPYIRGWVISENDQPSWGLKTVTVSVSWTDSSTHFTRVAGYVRCSAVPCP